MAERVFLALLSMLMLAVPASAKPAAKTPTRDWTRVVAAGGRAPEAGFAKTPNISGNRDERNGLLLIVLGKVLAPAHAIGGNRTDR